VVEAEARLLAVARREALDYGARLTNGMLISTSAPTAASPAAETEWRYLARGDVYRAVDYGWL
jgi:hypothetical protein